jgi:hypothetical protein
MKRPPPIYFGFAFYYNFRQAAYLHRHNQDASLPHATSTTAPTIQGQARLVDGDFGAEVKVAAGKAVAVGFWGREVVVGFGITVIVGGGVAVEARRRGWGVGISLRLPPLLPVELHSAGQLRGSRLKWL